MKKLMSMILMIVMMVTMFSTTVFTVTESKVGFVLNGKVQTWDEKTYGSLFVKDGRTFIPLRAVSEKLGYKVTWNAKTNSADIEKGETKISFVIGKPEVTTAKGVVTLDVKPFTMNGRTYVPMRGLFEAVGMEVRWLSAKVTASEIKTSITNMKSDFYVVVVDNKGTDADTDTGTESDPDNTDKPDETITDKEFLEEDGGLKTEFWEKFLEKNVPAGTETYASETLVLVGQSNWIAERFSYLSISPDHDEIWITIQGSQHDYIKSSVLSALNVVAKSSDDAKFIYDGYYSETITESWSKAKDGTQYRASNDAGYGVTIHIKQ